MQCLDKLLHAQLKPTLAQELGYFLKPYKSVFFKPYKSTNMYKHQDFSGFAITIL